MTFEKMPHRFQHVFHLFDPQVLMNPEVNAVPAHILRVRELTFLYGSQLLNVDINIAVGISFLFYLITAMVSLAGIWYVFRPIRLVELHADSSLRSE